MFSRCFRPHARCVHPRLHRAPGARSGLSSTTPCPPRAVHASPLLAHTIARMPTRTGSGSVGQASTTARRSASSGSIAAELLGVLLGVVGSRSQVLDIAGVTGWAFRLEG